MEQLSKDFRLLSVYVKGQLSSYLFHLGLDLLVEHNQGRALWCIFYAYDIDLVGEWGEGIN